MIRPGRQHGLLTSIGVRICSGSTDEEGPLLDFVDARDGDNGLEAFTTITRAFWPWHRRCGGKSP